MYAIREEMEPQTGELSREDQDHDEEQLSVVHSNSKEQEDQVLGSQYSSEGELYPLTSDYETSRSDNEATEQFRSIRELNGDISSEDDSDECPSLQSMSD